MPPGPQTLKDFRARMRAATGKPFPQEKLADLLEVDEMTVSRWERGIVDHAPYLWRALMNIEREVTGDCDVQWWLSVGCREGHCQ